MSEYTLQLELLSDTAFGRGDGVAGVVDAEIQHDESGLPMLSGRAIKGLLVTECAEILAALPKDKAERWQTAARQLFGVSGETVDEPGGLFIGPATVAPDLAAHVRYDVGKRSPSLSREQVLDSLTAIRRQTAVDAASGAPKDETLRATRVAIRGLKLYARLAFETERSDDERALLAACVMSLRRAGSGRTRGKGKLRAEINTLPLDPAQFAAAAPATDLAPEWLKPLKEVLACMG